MLGCLDVYVITIMTFYFNHNIRVIDQKFRIRSSWYRMSCTTGKMQVRSTYQGIALLKQSAKYANFEAKQARTDGKGLEWNPRRKNMRSTQFLLGLRS